MSLMRRLKKGMTIWRREATRLPPGLHLFNWLNPPHLTHLLLAAVCRLRPLGGAAERSAIVAEVTGGVHLVLWEGK